ncbi:hypothetical protein [Polluticaenibacter yanchengensis]|uniref:DUF4064 domain-containing protein n=1 Tax=Polluticaenibacter yanchengensis TaxID=3014562 RepID=A0ABT4UGJ6_9BACT|nr:hypothetical protein [Chitinophagaceae bacterium LY-5]
MSETFNEFFDEIKGKDKRSTFLTVLCILTFIGSTLAIFQQGYIYYKPETQYANSSNMNKTKTDNKFVNKMAAAMEEFKDLGKIQNNAMFGMLTAIITLTGGILMFKQNKKGFYLYIAGCFLSILIPFLIYPDNFIIKLGLAFNLFICIVFCIMYAFCLKEMK